MKLEEYKISHCTCKECVSYCEKRPGWFRPGEMARLAEFLKMPLKEVFKKYLIVDFWSAEESNVYLLSPVKDFSKVEPGPERETLDMLVEHNEDMGRKNCDKAGSYASWSYAFLYAPCIFLKGSKCSIYEARPFECKVTWHKKGEWEQLAKSIRELVMEEWKKSKLVSELLGGG